MKKIVAILAVLTTVASVQAALISRDWSSQITFGNVSGFPSFLPAPESDGDGAGWAYEIWNLTDDVAIPGSEPADQVTGGWLSGNGYVFGGFNFTAFEGTEVALRVYNHLDKPTAGWYLQSVSQVLADLDETNPPGPNDLDVTFNFAGQTWTQIPEPATFSLIGLVGIGMIVARRRMLRKASDL